MNNKFTLKFGTPNCNQLMITSLGVVLRGTFSIAAYHSKETPSMPVEGPMANMPDIPSEEMIVDCEAKTVTKRDPMGDEENEQKVKRVRSIEKSTRLAPGNPSKPITWNLNDDNLKTFLIEMHRFIDNKSATVHGGRMPTLEQIKKMDGHQLNDPMNTSASKPKYAKDVDAFNDKINAGA